MLNFKNLETSHAADVQTLCISNFCGTLTLILKYNSKAVPIYRNLQKPGKCLCK